MTIAQVPESAAPGSATHQGEPAARAAGVSLRPFPFPYRAALAICSDLDETPSAVAYLETARFLTTTEPTALGTGVGLEAGNTIYFDMPAGQFSYWNADDRGRGEVRALIRSGHVDCLHSFGDLATTRAHAGRALDELARHDCALAVWVDHGVAVSNFGAAKVNTASGDIDFERVGGDAQVNSASGDVSFDHIDGALTVNTASLVAPALPSVTLTLLIDSDGSSSRIVPMPMTPVAGLALVTGLMTTWKVSFVSGVISPMMLTVMVFEVWPGVKVSTPELT